MYPVLLIILVISALLGYRVISRVPSLLHTPLMSGMNALSGVTLLGAVAVYSQAPSAIHPWAGLALILATLNVVGGFLVTDRMLGMFKEKDPEKVSEERVPWQ